MISINIINDLYFELNWDNLLSLDDLSLTQLATRPTRGNNTLDLVITNNPSLVTACRVIPGVSDHDAVLTELGSLPVSSDSGVSSDTSVFLS